MKPLNLNIVDLHISKIELSTPRDQWWRLKRPGFIHAYRESRNHPCIRVNQDAVAAIMGDHEHYLRPAGLKGQMRLPFGVSQGIHWTDVDGDECYGIVSSFSSPRLGSFLEAIHFIIQDNQPVPWLVASQVRVDEDGYARVSEQMSPTDESGVIAVCHQHVHENKQDQLYSSFSGILMFSVISLLNCRNVSAKDVPLTHSQARNAKRGEPVVRYKELVVFPPGTGKGHEGHSLSEGSALPLHLARGHFKTFKEGESKGLFGKHFGTFWWPSQLRGDAEQGMVIKDYVLKTDKPVDEPAPAA